MADKTDPLPPDRGEHLVSQWTIKWMPPYDTLPPNTHIVPAELDTTASRELSALTLSLHDLSFSLECFAAADKLGRPDVANLQSKTLLFSAVVAYARAFDRGVRDLKLTPAIFAGAGQAFDLQLHQFLIDVRDKHVAHSVNEFKSCQTVAIMVRPPGAAWRPAGLGSAETYSIGLGRQHVHQALSQLSAMIATLRAMIELREAEAFEAFKEAFGKDSRWTMAPIARLPDRAKARTRRRSY